MKIVKIVTIMTLVMVMTFAWGTGNTLANRREGGKTTTPAKLIMIMVMIVVMIMT